MATDREKKVQEVRNETSLSNRSMFATSSHSTPLPNRRPVGQESKHTPTAEEVAAIPPFRGVEQPVEKSFPELVQKWEELAKAEQIRGEVVKTLDTGDGTATLYTSGLSTWLSKTDPYRLAGDGFKVLERQHREQNPVAP